MSRDIWGIAAMALALGACAHFPAAVDSHWSKIRATATVTDEELHRQIDAMMEAPPPPASPMSGKSLRSGIIDALKIGDLLSKIETRRIKIRKSAPREFPGYSETELSWRDPYLGRVDALLLLPLAGSRPLPAVLSLHGHNDTNRVQVEQYMGVELARAGYAVFLPNFPALAEGDSEISWALLRKGRSLLGLHVYETLAALKYLRSLKEIDRSRIGLLGHSGGSSNGNLVVRLDNSIAAQVSDYTVDYRDLLGWRKEVHCETLPRLFPLSTAINDESTLTVPRLNVSYGFSELRARKNILAFFSTHLKRTPPPAEASGLSRSR